MNSIQLLNYIQLCVFLGHIWGGNEYGEKGTQPVKIKFVTKKGKCAVNTMEKLCSKKIMKHITNEIDCN